MGEPRAPRRVPEALAAARGRAGTVRVRLTVAVTLLFAAALSIGATLLVRSVEHTVLRAVEAADREQLEQIRGQIERGVSVRALRLPPPPRETHFEIRLPDGTLVGPSEHEPPPPPVAQDAHEVVLHGPPPPPIREDAHEVRLHEPPPPPIREDAHEIRLHEPPPPPVAEGAHGVGLIHPVPPGPACGAPPPPRVLHVAGRSPFGFGVAGTANDGVRRTWIARDNWSVVEVPSISPEVGPLRLLAASPVDDVRRSAETLRRVLWLAMPLLLALIAAAAWMITGRALSPVLAMTRQVGRITTATLHERLPEPGTGDEIAALSRTLNGMLARLDEASRRQREFVSDASHELRSPIASLRAQLEVAIAHPAGRDWPAVAHSALAEGLRLEALVADLLLLARLDERAAVPQAEVDLDDVVLDEVRRPRRVAIDASRVGAGRVRGDAGHLTRVARNLLDNAARHARARVEVSLTREGDEIVLAVDDDGPGVPEAERERVFERFTRLEGARSRDAGGVGLGLALVRRVAERHGGSARILDSQLGGARAEVRLPVAAP